MFRARHIYSFTKQIGPEMNGTIDLRNGNWVQKFETGKMAIFLEIPILYQP